MKLLIPTAKELNLSISSSPALAAPLSPLTIEIVEMLASYSVEDLASFYKINLERAETEYQRLQQLKTGVAPLSPALYLFDGLMYRHIKRDNLTQEEEAYLTKYLYITSSLYGIIPVLSAVAPHRLDFMMSLKLSQKSLTSCWRPFYDEAVKEDQLLISFLSAEFETVFSKEVRHRMIRFRFFEEKNGVLKQHSTISKKARGDLLTAMIEKQVTQVEEIKKLQFSGFLFHKEQSTNTDLVFVKSV